MSTADIQAKAFTDNNVAREAIEALCGRMAPYAPWLAVLARLAKLREIGSTRAVLLRRFAKSSSP